MATTALGGIRPTLKLDWVRFWTAIGVLAFLALSWWGILSYASMFAQAADPPRGVEMMRMPGTDKPVPMPPKAMRDQIEQRMRQGKVPPVTMADPRQIASKCHSHGYLLGCTLDYGAIGKVIFIRKGMSREMTHFTKVHEFAHALYGWKH